MARNTAFIRPWCHACSAGAVLLLSAACHKDAPPPAPPPPEVKVAPVTERDAPIEREWVGTVAGSVDAVIRAQVSATS